MLFFSSDRATLAGATRGANYDLYWSSRPSVGSPWGAPQPVPGVNSASDEYDPFVAQGGLVIFFTSMKIGRRRHLLVGAAVDLRRPSRRRCC